MVTAESDAVHAGGIAPSVTSSIFCDRAADGTDLGIHRRRGGVVATRHAVLMDGRGDVRIEQLPTATSTRVLLVGVLATLAGIALVVQARQGIGLGVLLLSGSWVAIGGGLIAVTRAIRMRRLVAARMAAAGRSLRGTGQDDSSSAAASRHRCGAGGGAPGEHGEVAFARIRRIGVRGFEPPASTSRTWRANQAALHPVAGSEPTRGCWFFLGVAASSGSIGTDARCRHGRRHALLEDLTVRHRQRLAP